jgi:tetratricopeptide (TPR) repeat protein
MLRRIVSSCSLILLLCAFALGTDYGALEKAFDASQTGDQRQHALDHFINENPNLGDTDGSLKKAIDDYDSEDATNEETKKLEDMIAARARLQGSPPPPANVTEQAKQIKSSTLYHGDKGNLKQSNWMQKAMQHLADLFHPPREPQLPGGALPIAGGMGFIGYLIIGVLVATLLAFLIYAVSQFTYRRSLERKAKALLEDDEPERTADEWLELADGLTRQGRYREAVRCLYLACLLRFDEARISRFERSETNWEHLGRFNASPRRPNNFDFTTQTRAFDLIWYGKQVRGIEDVERFRAWYNEVVAAIREPVTP